MAVAPVGSATSTAGNTALDFPSLLRLILTELTYQDPLKPMDNFEFISQLAQFSQLQQSQSLNDQVSNLVFAQATTQATGLLGRTVDFSVGDQPVSGVVQAVTLSSGQPFLTVRTSAGEVISSVSIATVSQVR